MIVSVQDCYDYLGIDYADEFVERRITALIKTAESYLSNAIGENFQTVLVDEKLQIASQLALMFIGELYDNRDISSKEQHSIKNLYSSLLFQLQIEYEGEKI